VEEGFAGKEGYTGAKGETYYSRGRPWKCPCLLDIHDVYLTLIRLFQSAIVVREVFAFDEMIGEDGGEPQACQLSQWRQKDKLTTRVSGKVCLLAIHGWALSPPEALLNDLIREPSCGIRSRRVRTAVKEDRNSMTFCFCFSSCFANPPGISFITLGISFYFGS